MTQVLIITNMNTIRIHPKDEQSIEALKKLILSPQVLALRKSAGEGVLELQ